MNRRPKQYSSWSDQSEMKAYARLKVLYYKVELSPNPKKLIDLKLCAPFARYSLKGQQRSVEMGKQSELWLILQIERRCILNPEVRGWDVAILVDNQSVGYPQKVLKYYETVRTGDPRKINVQDWPKVTHQIHQLLTQRIKNAG